MYHRLLFLPKNDWCLSPKFQGSVFGFIKGYKVHSFGGKQQKCRDRAPLSSLSAFLREATALVSPPPSRYCIFHEYSNVLKTYFRFWNVRRKCQRVSGTNLEARPIHSQSKNFARGKRSWGVLLWRMHDWRSCWILLLAKKEFTVFIILLCHCHEHLQFCVKVRTGTLCSFTLKRHLIN